MQPYTRETLVDRRQPAVRWSAIFAGTAVAVGAWLLLQIFGMGAGLAAVDADNAGSLRGVGIGTSVWSLIAPLIAIFAGAWIASKLAATRDEKVGGLHGVIVWALTSVLGVMLAVSLVSAIVPRTVVYDTPAAAYDDTYHPLAPTHQQLKAADHTGKALLAAGTSMLLSLGTAILGGILAVRGFGKRGEGHGEHRLRTHHFGHRTHDTLQTQAVPPPPIDTAV